MKSWSCSLSARRRLLCALPFAVLCAGARAQTTQLIANGTFETGTLAGWTTATRSLGSDTYDGTGSPAGTFAAATGTTAPLSSLPTPGAKTGTYYALADMNTSGAHILYQTVTIPTAFITSITLKYDLFAYDWYGSATIDSTGLDPTTGGSNPTRLNQHARVDILTGTLGSGNAAFTTTANGIQNFYAGADPESQGNNPTAPAWRSYSQTLTGLTGGQTYTLRFGVVDNGFPLDVGVDNVSFTVVAAATPETGTLALCGVGGVALAMAARRRSRV